MAAAQNISVRVGVVLDMDEYGKMAFNCISMALSDFYTTHDSYNTRLFLYNRDSNGDVIGAAAAGLDLLKNIEVQAIIGPMYSVQANFLISLGQKAHVPIITFSATSPSLSSLRSPYFVRATLNDSTQVNPIVAIIQAFKWKEVVPIYEDNEFGEGIVPFLSDALEQVNVRVPYRSVIPSLATDEQIVDELNKLKTMQTRVFIVHMLRSLGSRLFAKAAQLGMMSKDYAWIITDSITNELTAMDPSLVASMLGVIGVKPYIPQTKELDDFAIRYKNKIQQSNPKALNLDIYGIWAYDSALALAMAVEKAELANLTYQKTNTSTNSTDLEAFGVSLSGPKLIQALLSITFRGLAGNFQLVDGQLQAPPYEIVNIVGPGASGIGYWTKENGIVNKLNFSSSSASAYSTSKDNLGSITWPGNESSPPKGWVVPTKTKKMRVGVPVKDGFTEFVRVTWNSDNSTTVEGFCIDIFDAVMKALPYDVPYEYIPFATPDHKMAGDYNEMAYQVYLGVFPIDSPLVPDVSREILNVTEVQKMVDIEKKWLGDESKCPDTDTKSIGLSSFRVVFIIVGTVGIAVVINYMIRQGRENKNVHKDDPPIVHNDPPIVHNDPPIVHNDPPIIHNDPPIIHNDPPIVHNDPQLSIMIPQLSIMIPQLSIMIPKLSIMIPQLRDRYMSYG
ncbi:hypothetical protein MIMGU_mgv1a018131mg, partial [Erythranthe guttata]